MALGATDNSVPKNSSAANVILEAKGNDEYAGYIFSPIIGLSKIRLSRKFRRQLNWHVPVIPYIQTKPELSPISESYFEIDDDDDELIDSVRKKS
ncbi:uncharacterized protein CEXT_198051 [Caerostris extrusa]|uniref:Uncharacterized protein n=1 Tax=Caerostris extrusa TaxID=172846 RepID=A0AAV4XGH0_CAEEX|nr:uncharacterized protein CEXT_198051 [Caerostris extrusa]